MTFAANSAGFGGGKLDEQAETLEVLIVGAGPAGLAAAVALRQAGVGKVVVVERQDVAGGIPRQCGHSPFGMREFHRLLSGKRYAERLVDAAVAAGAELRLNHSVVEISEGPRALVATAKGVQQLAPRQILLATGIREATRASRLVSGQRPLGVMNTAALQDMVFLRRLRPFKRPVIVGTELVSMSAILTCLTAGARPAAIIEARPRSVVRAPFSWLPRLLRIPIFRDQEIADISGNPTVDAVMLRDRAGAITRIACDGVLFTGSFTPEASLVRNAGIAIDDGSAGPVVDTCGRTDLAGVYAAGNILRGVETAGRCWAEGRAVAAAMAADLRRDNLAPAGRLIETGPGVKFAMPQRIATGEVMAFPAIQIRLDDWLTGELAVEDNGKTVWRRKLTSGPERRIAVPLAALPTQPEGKLRIVVRNGRGG